MHITLESQILRHRKRNLRSNQTFHHRIVSQIQEHAHMIGDSAFLECLAEELRHIVLDAHRPEHNRELLIRPAA